MAESELGISAEYGDRVYDKKYYIHFPTKQEILQICKELVLVECGVCDEIRTQPGRGKSLSYKENYWVFRR